MKKKVNGWNHYGIVVSKGKAKYYLNGKEVKDFDVFFWSKSGELPKRKKAK